VGRLIPSRGAGAVAGAELVLVALIAIAYGAGGPLQVAAALVLAPIAVAAVHAHGARLGGERFGVGAAAVYLVLPLAGVLYALPTYRSTYTHGALPSLVGLEHTGWFALGVAVAVSTLALPRQVFAAAGAAALFIGIVAWGFSPLGDVKTSLHEDGWSVAFLEWVLAAGFLGALRRSPWIAIGLGGWLALVVLRAAHRPFDDGAFWSSLAPAAPAAALLTASIWLLVPRLRRSPASSSPASSTQPDAP
jgi:hypothetical protein